MEQSSIEELEKSVIGCFLMKPKLLEETYLTEELFNINKNKFFFKVIQTHYKKYKLIDLTLLTVDYKKELENNKWFLDYYAEIQNSMATSAHFDYYQDKMIDEYKKRLILQTIDSFKAQQTSEEDLIENLNKIQMLNLDKKEDHLTGEYIYNEIVREDHQIKFRFIKLSETIKLSEHDFLVIGSRPGAGKTGFALNLLEDMSQKYNCVYFNMEMSEQQVLRRLVSINSKIPIANLNNPETEHQGKAVKASSEIIAKRKLQIITGSQTMPMIKSKIIKEARKEHTIAFIDYVGLIHTKNKNQSIYERITEIAKELRMISMNYDCTIICIAQINRSGDNKPPLLSELKDSGELEQSAVSVILLHNENYYKKEELKVETLKCMVAKNRNGRTGTVNLDYNQYNQKIDEPYSSH